MPDTIYFVACVSRCAGCGSSSRMGQVPAPCCDAPQLEPGILALGAQMLPEYQPRQWLVDRLESGCRVVDWLSDTDCTAFAQFILAEAGREGVSADV